MFKSITGQSGSTQGPLQDSLQVYRRQVDRVLWLPALAHLLLSVILTPLTGTWGSLGLFLLLALLPAAIVHHRWPGSVLSGLATAWLFMALSALLIEQTGGMIEAHFSIFIMLSALILYADWRVILFGAMVIAVHHASLTVLQYHGLAVVYAGIASGHEVHDSALALFYCLLMHAGAVVAQTIILSYLAERLSKMLSDGLQVVDYAHQASQGRLDQVFTPDQLERPALQAVAEMQARFTAALREAQETSAAVSGLSEDLFTAQGQLRTQSSTNAQALERIASSSSQLRESTGLAAEEVQATRRLASAASTSAQEGNAQVDTLRGNMVDIEDAAMNIAQLLQEIDQITFQTNLLALNASVEAARAGQEGRGFAVVANEVRSLSHRTEAAARQIRERVEAAAASIEEGRMTVEQAHDVMGAVVSSFAEVEQRMSGLERSLQQQNTGNESLDAGIRGIRQAVVESNTALDRCHALSAEQQQSATRLLASVGSFQLG